MEEKTLRIALDIGEHLLINGAEVSRVEDTVTRICRLLDVTHIEVFCIATLLQVSVHLEDGRYFFQMRRIKSNGNNLAKLEILNGISRRLCDGEISFDEADAEIKEAKRHIPHRAVTYYVAAVLGSSAFCIFFGGRLSDGIAAAVAAIPVMFLERHPIKNSIPHIHTVVEAFLGGIIGNLMFSAGIGTNIDLICIGVMMLLIPGITFGVAMQDFMKGDVLAGSSKLVHAIILTAMIVIGLGLSMVCFGRWI